MKQYMKSVMTTALMLLFAIGAWADPTVIVKKQLNGTATETGMVTNDISEGVCTLTVTPPDGSYVTVDYITACSVWDGNMAQTPRRDPGLVDNPIVVTALDANADPSGVTKYTFTVPTDGSDVELTVNFQSRKTLSVGMVADIADQTYMGAELKPALTIKDGGATLVEDKDYTVEYSNNVNVGTTAKATITGKGVYTGSVEKTFTISAASIAEAEVTVSGTYTYTGAAIQPTTGNISVTFNNEELRAGTDYEIQGYSNNTNAATANSENAPTVTIKGKGNYSGTVTQTFTIAAKDLASATVTVDPTQTYTYTGSAITPNVSSVSIKLTEGAEAATNLTAGTDYTVTGYANNTNAATATSENAPIVTITGQGNFTGTATGKFTIAQADLSDAEIADIDDQDYTGEAVTPEPQVSVVLIAGNDPTVLVKGQDFNYNYENNVAVSSETNTPKVIVTGTGNYKGSAQKTFNIVASYDIWVAGTLVTSNNANNVLGGTEATVSYDEETNTLALNGATIEPEGEGYGIEYTGTDDLVISLNGTNNVVKGGGNCNAILYNGPGVTDPTLTFTNGSENPCKLQLESVGTATIDGFASVVNTGLYRIDDANGSTQKTTITSLGGGSGTAADPIIIKTTDDLKNFSKLVNRGTITNEYIALNPEGETLDCLGLTGFEPIGSGDYPFEGTFLGNSWTISNLTAQDGLFKYISGATIVALNLSGCTFTGATDEKAAGIVVYAEDNSTIDGCTITGSTIACKADANNPTVGGIVAYSSSSTIKNCVVYNTQIKAETTNSTGTSGVVGGIVGEATSGKIENCHVKDESKITDYNANAGATLNAGAIVGKYTGTTLSANYYYYDVTVETLKGTDTANKVAKDGYTQRALGNGDDVSADNGAVMYTKKLTLTDGVAGECDYYEPLSNSIDGIFALAPDQDVDIDLDPTGGKIISAASLVYTLSGEQTVPLANIADDGYSYSFKMPDADATLNTTLVQGYDLWIGGTRVSDANKDHVLGEGNTTVTFAVTGNEAAGYVNTLTLNGAALTVPVKVGLDNLTIDIQGTNSITTDTTCIQNTAATGVPTLTFKSTSAETGSLTLTDTDEEGTNGVISSSFYSNNTNYVTISKELALIMLRNGNYTSDTYYFSAGEVHNAQLVPSYGVQVNDMQVYEGNVEDVLGDGKVSFDKSTHTLTLDNASGISTISTTLRTLDIDLVGSNSLYRSSDGSIFESASGEAVTINLKSTGATKGSLTMEAPKSNGATLKGDNVTLTPVDPIVLLSSDVTENKGTLVYGVSYGLTVAGVTVSNANASNVLGGETATVVFTPANATEATPATLTLNGANFTGSIVSGLENLTVVINGENTTGKIEGNTTTNTDKNITFKGGTDGSTLTITSTLNSALEGFAAVSYDGAYPASPIPSKYYTGYQEYIAVHGSDINYPLQTLTISTTPHYPLWIGATQINDNNKDDVFAGTALGGKVSYNSTSKTLSLTNAELSSHYIMSDLDALRISVEGDCVIAAADSSAAVRSMNGAATLTIAKKNSSSTDISTLKLGTDFSTASISWFNSVDYSDFILLSEGATYEDKLLKDSDGESLTQATFTTGLKKPTIQMNYETNTYSFNNPNGGGTLKYKRTYIDGTETVNDEGEMSNTTFNIDGRPDYFEVWVEANGNSSDKLYACRLDVKDMTATYGGTVPDPVFLPKSIEGVTVSGYSLGTHEAVAATVTEGNITLTGAGRQELEAIFSIPDGIEYIKTSTTETPQASFYLDVKPAKPTLSKAAGTYAGTQNITVTNLTPNAIPMYYTYEGEEPENPVGTEFTVDGGVDIESSKTLAVYYRASYETETSMEYLDGETTKAEYTILADPELAFVQEDEPVDDAVYTIGAASNPALPELQNPHSLIVTYESDKPDVATVAADGTVTVVGIGTAVITATTAATDVYAAGEASYTLAVKRQLDVSFSETNEWATYYGTESLAIPTGLKAYQVTAVDGSTVTIEEISYIPANTAVLLRDVEGKAVSVNIAASAYEGETTTFPNNILQGGEELDVSTVTDHTVYVLYKDKFKRATSGTIPANRGYLVVEPSDVNASELSITIGDDTTGVQTLNVERGTLNDDSWYTIDGRKVNGQSSMVNGQLKPGLYIKNGKKVVINKK